MTRTPKPWTAAEIAAAKAWERDRVAENRCPWSGLVLAPVPGTPAAEAADRRRCSICDCPGYPVRVGQGEQDAGMEATS